MRMLLLLLPEAAAMSTAAGVYTVAAAVQLVESLLVVLEVGQIIIVLAVVRNLNRKMTIPMS